MKRFWVLFVWLPLFAADFVPGRYIVELSGEPMAHTASRQHRARIRSEQSAAREAVSRSGGQVMRSLENVKNALIVEMPDAKSARLSAIAGVRRVYPVRTFHLLLDRAVALHQAPAAWTQVGITNAGAGVRIAIIDTGIDAAHPGFQDASLTPPSGFPRVTRDADLAYTNSKVIVARSYADLFAHQDPDPSPADHVGHGTATAMAAAGVQNAGPLATITGMAPRAYIGNYKVFGTPGVNDQAGEDAILAAIDDAISDGMDIISLSLGSDVAIRFDFDPEVEALENAAAMGVIVVAAAGNNGPDPLTIGTPAAAPSVLAVGATQNDRMFASSVLLTGGTRLIAVPGSGSNAAVPVSGPLFDVARLDGTGLGCSGFGPGALAGSIAFILRGTCSFEAKLTNAAAAGAVGAVVYNNVDGEGPIAMYAGAATLPAEMVGNRDGIRLRDGLAQPLDATLDFSLLPAAIDPAQIGAFSARGPNIDLAIKPDLMAVGANLYTAAQKLDPNGALYDASGYGVQQGTSFSAPLVAGAAAVLKAARPGLSSAQYRSLLANTASPAWLIPGTPAGVQQGGAGSLNLLSGLNATVAAAPLSLSFGAGAGTADVTRSLLISNVGTSPETFQISAVPRNGGPAPEINTGAVALDPGQTVPVAVTLSAGGLAPGQYDGFLHIQANRSGTATNIPYWYGVTSDRPTRITVLFTGGANGASAGSSVSEAAVFRITDDAGLPVTAIDPVVTAVSGGGSVVRSGSIDPVVPFGFDFAVRLGRTPGPNVFQIQAGDVTKDIVIVGR